MTIIVKHLNTGNEYILLGTGLGTAKGSLPSRVLSDLFTTDHPDKVIMVSACDVQGRIVFLKSDEVIVTEIDGQKPSEILPEIITTSSQLLLENTDLDIDREREDKYLDEDLDQDLDEDDEEWV